MPERKDDSQVLVCAETAGKPLPLVLSTLHPLLLPLLPVTLRLSQALEPAPDQGKPNV